MTEPTRASSSSSTSSAAGRNPAPPGNDASSSQKARDAAAATQAIDASRQAGVVNPGELSKEVAKSYERDPKEGAALHDAVNQQLSPRDQASLNDHLSATVGAVAGARTTDATATRSFPTADDAARDALNKANPTSVQDNLEYGGKIAQDPATGRYSATAPRAGSDTGFNMSGVRTPTGAKETGNYHTHGDYSTAGPNGEAIRTSNPAQDHFNSDNFSPADRANYRANAQSRPGYTGYLGTPSGDYRSFDPATNSNTVMGRQPSAADTTARAAGQGALIGAAVDGALTAGNALRDGRIDGNEAKDIVANSARGAVVGGTYSVTEQGLVRAADRKAGVAIERGTANVAARLGAADSGAVGAAARTVATRLGGAGAAGAVIGAGMSIYENREGLAQGDSQAIGRVAGDTVVAASAALSGAAAGAALGSVVPGVGTVVGAVVGLGAGMLADHVMRAGGVDKAIGNAVAGGVDAVKGAASKVAGWFGW